MVLCTCSSLVSIHLYVPNTNYSIRRCWNWAIKKSFPVLQYWCYFSIHCSAIKHLPGLWRPLLLNPRTSSSQMDLSIKYYIDVEPILINSFPYVCHQRPQVHSIFYNICSNMGVIRDSYTKMKTVRKWKTNTMWYHLHVQSKLWRKWTYLQNRRRLTDIEKREGEGIGWTGSLGLVGANCYI